MPEAPQPNDETLNNLENLLSQLDEPSNTVVSQEIVVEEQTTATQITVTEPVVEDNPIKIREFVERYETGFDEILTSVRSDRTEAQKAIDFCNTELAKMATNGRVSPSLVESLVQAIKVKADINTNYIKCIDAGAKLLSATKSAININNNNNNSNTTSLELTALLSQEVPDDDI